MTKQIKNKKEFDPKLFLEAINEISKRNLLEEKDLKIILENAFFKTFYSKVNPDAKLELNIDLDNKKFELINHSKLVISNKEFDEEFSSSEISLNEAKKIKENVKEGEEVSEIIDLAKDKKFIVQVKQLILQNIREKKKESIYIKYKDLKDTMIFAEVIASKKGGHAILKLDDGIIAYMPPKLKNQNIDLKIGQRIKVYVEDILKESKDSQIIVSNGSPNMIKQIIISNVPEVEEGIVEIVKISRIPGLRSKVSVKTQNENVDPVGAIIGSGGERIKSILSKLNGEKLDIIAWIENEDKYIANSLSPARVISVLPKRNENNEIIEKQKIIITPNIHQTLAIGQLGSNARLAVELTNNRLDIISLDKAKNENIEIIWNGNVKQEELENIEKNIKTKTRNIRKNNLTFDFSNEINDFSESINSDFYEDENEEKNSNEYEIEDDIFSSEELKKMESNFELDPELMSFDSDFNDDKEEDFD